MTVLTGLNRGTTDSVGSITSVANIAALRALTTSTGPDSPDIVYVADYAVAGAGGGGFFKCQAAGAHPATASFTASLSNADTYLTVTAISPGGYISVGDVIGGSGVPNNMVVIKPVFGATGGIGSYFVNYFGVSSNLSSRAMTSTSDNGATCIVDASGRRWFRQWDRTGFDVRWAGIFTSNVDNGPLIGRLPKYATNYFQDGVYQFASYPTFTDMLVTISRGPSTIFNCTGALVQFDLNSPAFSWNWGPTPYHLDDIQIGIFNGLPVGSMAVMASASISPLEGIGIVAQFDGTHGVGLQLGYTGDDYPSFVPLYTRPKNFTVGGFYCNVIYGPAISHVFLTGLDEAVMRTGGIGYRYDNYPNSDSGENLANRRCNFNGHYGDGMQLVGSQRQDVDTCSLTYNHRAMYITGTPVFVSSYFETNIANTPAENFAVDVNANLILTSRTSLLHFDRYQGNYVLFGGTPGSRGSQVFFDRCTFTDTVSNSTNLPNGQFLQSEAGLQIHGSVMGWNGINFPPCLSPNQCMQPNWNFVTAGLALYPGSSGCTNQTSVVHSPQTNAVSMTGAATLQFATMDVKPGELIYVTMVDKVVGTISTLVGSMVFKTADGITVATTAFSQTPSVADWHYNPVTLSPNWATSVHDWAFEGFVFRVPIGASEMTGSFSTTGGGNYYISELAIYRQ